MKDEGPGDSASRSPKCQRLEGIPAYAQFDNDTRVQGAHQHRHAISRVMRLCLSLHVAPVFVPSNEMGVQAATLHQKGDFEALTPGR
jgi:hypothetical protein